MQTTNEKHYDKALLELVDTWIAGGYSEVSVYLANTPRSVLVDFIRELRDRRQLAFNRDLQILFNLV